MSDTGALYFQQIPVGQMANFAYLIGSQSARQCLLVDPAWVPGMRVLCDYRDVSLWEVSAKETFQLVMLYNQFKGRLGGTRIAIVAPQDLVYGLNRMWQIEVEPLGLEVEVFRKVEPARGWLGLTVEEAAAG